eukprot:5549493-Prymnesium_polylepis.1
MVAWGFGGNQSSVPHTAEWRFAARETIVARASAQSVVFVRRQTAHLVGVTTRNNYYCFDRAHGTR